MNQILQETQILAPIYSYLHYTDHEAILIDAYEHYKKKTSRNRYQLLTTNGVVTLSVPLKKGKNSQTPVKDVLIAYDEPWHLQHLHAIRSAYGNSAYFEYYYSSLERIFMAQETHLLQFNLSLLKWAFKCLKLDCDLSLTTTYINPKEVIDTITDIRDQKVPDSYRFQSYPQVWSDRFDFITNLSILDLIFCMGHEATHILNQTKSLNNKLINHYDSCQS